MGIVAVAGVAMVGIGGGASAGSSSSSSSGEVVARVRVAPSAVAAAAATSTSRGVGFIVHGIVVEGVRRTGVRGGRRRRRRRRTSPTELIGRHGHALLFVSFLVVVALAACSPAAVCPSSEIRSEDVCNRGSNTIREKDSVGFVRIRQNSEGMTASFLCHLLS